MFEESLTDTVLGFLDWFGFFFFLVTLREHLLLKPVRVFLLLPIFLLISYS